MLEQRIIVASWLTVDDLSLVRDGKPAQFIGKTEKELISKIREGGRRLPPGAILLCRFGEPGDWLEYSFHRHKYKIRLEVEKF